MENIVSKTTLFRGAQTGAQFFRAEDISWNQRTSINIHLQRKTERLRGEKSLVFSPGSSYKLYFKWEKLPIDDHNQAFLQFLKNDLGDLPLHPQPSSYALRSFGMVLRSRTNHPKFLQNPQGFPSPKFWLNLLSNLHDQPWLLKAIKLMVFK